MSVGYVILPGYEVKDPIRGTLGAAGMDVFCPLVNPVFSAQFDKWNPIVSAKLLMNGHAGVIAENDNKVAPKMYIQISPFCRVLIPTGLVLRIPENTYVDVATKSGRFSKTGLKVGSHVIDSDYAGQLLISLFNTTDSEAVIEENTAIAQLIHKPCYIEEWKRFETFEELHPVLSERGIQGFGHTDSKI